MTHGLDIATIIGVTTHSISLSTIRSSMVIHGIIPTTTTTITTHIGIRRFHIGVMDVYHLMAGMAIT